MDSAHENVQLFLKQKEGITENTDILHMPMQGANDLNSWSLNQYFHIIWVRKKGKLIL